jgi:hypothetical protein
MTQKGCFVLSYYRVCFRVSKRVLSVGMVGFDCEKGFLIKDVKVGHQVAVEYQEADGNKKATKVTLRCSSRV